MTEEPRGHPPMTPQSQRIEGAIDEAMRRGDFDDLPGAGKPLALPATHDPDWWIKQRIADDDVDRDALLPPVILLRREHDALEETLAELPDETAVCEYAEDFTSRVLSDRAANPLARQLAPTVDPDAAVDTWKRLRAERAESRTAQAPADRTPNAAQERAGRSRSVRLWRWLTGGS